MGTLGFKTKEIRVDYSESNAEVIVVRSGGFDGVIHCIVQTQDCQGISASNMAGEYDDYTPKWEKITFDSGETEIKVPITLVQFG